MIHDDYMQFSPKEYEDFIKKLVIEFFKKTF